MSKAADWPRLLLAPEGMEDPVPMTQSHLSALEAVLAAAETLTNKSKLWRHTESGTTNIGVDELLWTALAVAISRAKETP